MFKIFIAFALLFFVHVPQVSAHAEGLTPFLKINGTYPEINPIKKEIVAPTSFSIPEDLATEKFKVGEKITFSIDTSVLLKLYSQEVLDTVTYEWDMGDGSSAEGTELTHTYTTIGSKVVTISAKFNDPESDIPAQPIETVQIDILPDAAYKLPEPIITVDRRAFSQSSQEVNMRNPISFEAKIKKEHTAPITAYVWDFGEGGKGTGAKTVHTYVTDPAIVTPVLKVTDQNGFIVYTYSVLTNGKNTQGYTFATNTVGVIILGVQAVIVVVGVLWFTIVVRSKKHSKRT